MKVIYHAILLDKPSRDNLLRAFPAVHPNVKAEHVTLKFGVKDLPANLGKRQTMIVNSYAEDEKAQGVGVYMEDYGTHKEDGNRYHITISFADGAKPVHTNHIQEWDENVQQLVLDGVVAAFTNKGWITKPQ